MLGAAWPALLARATQRTATCTFFSTPLVCIHHCEKVMKRERDTEVEYVSIEYLNAIEVAMTDAERQRGQGCRDPQITIPPALFLGISGLRLVRNIITPNEEQALVQNVDNSMWNTSLKRRTQHYGYTYSYASKSIATRAPPIPEWCNFLVNRLLDQRILLVRPDQMIVNEYEPGQGIYPHVDSPVSFMDGIVSVSLASDVVMEFIHQTSMEKKEATLPRCSMISLNGDARYQWRHGIAARKTDHGVKRYRRVSLTFRKIK